MKRVLLAAVLSLTACLAMTGQASANPTYTYTISAMNNPFETATSGGWFLPIASGTFSTPSETVSPSNSTITDLNGVNYTWTGLSFTMQDNGSMSWTAGSLSADATGQLAFRVEIDGVMAGLVQAGSISPTFSADSTPNGGLVWNTFAWAQQSGPFDTGTAYQYNVYDGAPTGTAPNASASGGAFALNSPFFSAGAWQFQFVSDAGAPLFQTSISNVGGTLQILETPAPAGVLLLVSALPIGLIRRFRKS